MVDLRYADFTCADVEINAYSIMGGQTILLPPEVNVEIKGHGVMGGFDHEVNRTGTPGAPTVTIRGSRCGVGSGSNAANAAAGTEPAGTAAVSAGAAGR